MVRLRIVLSGGAGSMHHPYTISLSHILFFCLHFKNSFTNAFAHLCAPHSIISRLIRRCLIHHPSLMQLVAQPHVHSGVDPPTPFSDPCIHYSIHSLAALTYSPSRLLSYSLTHLRFQPDCQFYSDLIFRFTFTVATFWKRSVDILELRNFDPTALPAHHPYVTSLVPRKIDMERHVSVTSLIPHNKHISYHTTTTSHISHITHRHLPIQLPDIGHHANSTSNTHHTHNTHPITHHPHFTSHVIHITHISHHVSFPTPRFQLATLKFVGTHTSNRLWLDFGFAPAYLPAAHLGCRVWNQHYCKIISKSKRKNHWTGTARKTGPPSAPVTWWILCCGLPIVGPLLRWGYVR